MNTSTMPSLRLHQRPRRNRKSAAIRGLVEESNLKPQDIVCPLFLIEAAEGAEAIPSMPGVSRHSLSSACREIEHLLSMGVRAVDLFTVVPKERKDSIGSEASRPQNLLQSATRLFKEEFPELCVMVDVALDPFTDHGHDGVLDERGYVANDETVARLIDMSIGCAEAGADVIAPSDMMDGRVGAIRSALDAHGHSQVNILSYTAKYASAFYGPFRDALQSAPKFGDKKTYQMNPANAREALWEAELDVQEGADMLLVKPGLPYLDIIYRLREAYPIPVGAYHVSGEYSMVMAAAEKGWVDAPRIFAESLLALKRAGADFIFTYAAQHVFGN